MSLNDIIERFTLVSGMDRQEVSRCLPVILDCQAFFESRCRHDLSPADRRRAAYACAVYAYYKISLTAGGESGSFKAGDVQISTGNAGTDVARLWAEERAGVADIVDLDSGFGFRSVNI